MRYTIALTSALLLAMQAFAQEIEPHPWITEGNYPAREMGYAHCCDQKTHCRPLPEGAVEVVDENTWRLVATGRVFKRGEMGNYSSQDGRFWECHWSGEEPAYRCFFHAEVGS